MPQIPKDYYLIKDGKVVRNEKYIKSHSSCDEPIPHFYFEKQTPQLSEKSITELHNEFLQNEEKLKEIFFGDVEAPKEYDKFIKKNYDMTAEEVKLSQVAELAKNTAYILLHLKRWEDEEIIDGSIIAEWYKSKESAFTRRLKVPLETSYEVIKKILFMRGELSPHFRNEFETGYKELISVAEKCDKESLSYPNQLPKKPIEDFKLAAANFYKTMEMIHAEANRVFLTLKPPQENGGEVIDASIEIKNIEIDLSDFQERKKGYAKQMLKDLVNYPTGFKYSETHHGKNQPKTLCQRLRKKPHKIYKILAEHIHKRKEGHQTTIYLDKNIKVTLKKNTT